MPKPPVTAAEFSVPQELLHLVDGFIERRKNELNTLRDCLLRSDFIPVQRIAHNLTGNGTAYGFPQLTEIGRQLEASAKAGDHERSTSLTEALAVTVADIESKWSESKEL